MNSKKSLYRDGREEHEGKNRFISILLRALRVLRGSLSKNPGADAAGLAWIFICSSGDNDRRTTTGTHVFDLFASLPGSGIGFVRDDTGKK